jgi:Cu(I)/Ag(I) efflux system membrane fusion protein
MSDSSFAKPSRWLTTGRILWILALVAAFSLGMFLNRGGDAPTPEGGVNEAASEPARETVWTCSMHPQIKLPKEGQCPICFMDLIPLEDNGDGDLGPRTLAMSEGAASLAEIQTVAVRREVAEAAVRLIGKVTYDETRHKVISSWTAGRVDTLFVDFTGTAVSKGQPLASLYSPDLYSGQVELLSALKARNQLLESADQNMIRTAEATVASARERLRLWGLSPAQIKGVEAAGKASYHLTITSPLGGVVVKKQVSEGMYVGTGTPIYSVADLSKVWVTLEAYESDLAWLRAGQWVDFSVAALPGQMFQGEIIFIDPVLSEKTRTVGVRLNVGNSEGLLKPGMFVNATAWASLSGDETGQKPLVIPASAALITGKRAVVYVRQTGTDRPTFEGREVVLGPRAGNNYVVLAGLEEGELVVTKGNFKIDSALQIQAKPSMMSEQTGSTDEDGLSPMAVSAAFRQELGSVVAAYLSVQAALAADDDPAAQAASRAAVEALDEVDMSQLHGEAHQVWMGYAGTLREGFSAMAAAGDIEARRRPLLRVVDPLWETLLRFGFKPDQTLRRFNCPMANDNNGGDWLQLDPTTANPYYGSSMLRCGSQTDSLDAAAGPEGR